MPPSRPRIIMTTGNEDQRSAATETADFHSDDEHLANETTSLLHNENAQATNSTEALNEISDDQRRARRANILRWTRRDIAYGLLFSIPLLLFVPSVIFFIMTLNLRATFPPSPIQETIANLTHRVTQLSKSLGTCQDNTTNLAILLHDEKQRVEECRESGKRLAARVEFVEEMLEKCQADERDLKNQLENVKGDLGVCVDEREDLKRQMESGVFVQFLEMVGKMGTGGDSWVCSDTTPSWSYGYASDQSPHSTIKIQSWTEDLNDVEHSQIPLVFPQSSSTSNPSEPALPNPTGPLLSKSIRRSKQETMDQSSHSMSGNGVSGLEGSSIRVIGYYVKSQNTSGSNGWWRITKLPAFGVKGQPIEFFALAGKWYKSKSRFEVTVYYVESDGDSSMLIRPE